MHASGWWKGSRSTGGNSREHGMNMLHTERPQTEIDPGTMLNTVPPCTQCLFEPNGPKTLLYISPNWGYLWLCLAQLLTWYITQHQRFNSGVNNARETNYITPKLVAADRLRKD